MNRKRIIVTLIVVVVLAALGAGGAWYLKSKQQDKQQTKAKENQTAVIKQVRKQQTVKTSYLVIFQGAPDNSITAVNKNDDLVWQNLDAAAYTIVFEGGPAAVPQLTVAPQKETKSKFAQSGIYKYRAKENPKVTGTVEVY